MLRVCLAINTSLVLLPYHPGLVLVFYMSGSMATSDQYYIDNLHWLIPFTLSLASIPNLLIAVYFKVAKKKQKIWRDFIFAEGYVILIQSLLHAALLLFATYGPTI